MMASLETTDDGEGEDRQQPQIYAKNSFNRFDDDLCGHILSYLPLKSRFFYESVSKRFRRTVLKNVVDIDFCVFNGLFTQLPHGMTQTLVTIARKCPNIETIDCRQNRPLYGRSAKVLTIFRSNCQNLRDIYWKLDSNYHQLVSQFAPMITRTHCNPNAYHLLIQCHRLSHLRVSYLPDVFDTTSGQLLAKNLHKFEFNNSLTTNAIQFEAFIAGNQTLKSLTIYPSSGYPNNMNEMTEQLSRLPQLRELTLHLHLTDCQTLNSLRFCPQLKRLKIDMRYISKISKKMLDPMRDFRRLTHLTLSGYEMAINLLFNSCANQWPRLQYLTIENIGFEIDVKSLDQISRLPALRTLVISCLSGCLRDNCIEDLLSKSPKLNNIKIHSFSKTFCHIPQQTEHLKTSLETTDDGNEDNIQQPQTYAKDSMNRFGDDLCALLLSYFPLEDRFRCECLSKYFQNTVFGSVLDIDMDYKFNRHIGNQSITKIVETIARKCPNIETIDCREIDVRHRKHIPEVLQTFQNNCRHLREIYVPMVVGSDQWIQQFGQLVTRTNSGPIKQSLIHCHRLSHLKASDLSDVFDDDSGELLAKNLQSFECDYDLDSSDEQLSEFIAGNQSLKTLTIHAFESMDVEDIHQLSRLPQLRQLTLYLDGIGGQPLHSLTLFPRLRSLNIFSDQPMDAKLLDPLKDCQHLRHLELSSLKMDTNWWLNCHKHWPQLHYLSIRDNNYKIETFEHISRLPALQTLVVNELGYSLSNNDFCDLMARSARLKTIETHGNDRSYYRKH